MYSIDEDDCENAKEPAENEEDLQAWCLLEESQSSVTVERGEQRQFEFGKIAEVKDKWVKVGVTIYSGAAGHVMPQTTFPHIKLERKTSPKKFVAANGEQIKDLGEEHSIQDKWSSEVHDTRDRECCQPPHFNAVRSPEPETLLYMTKRIRTFGTLETEQ